MLVFSISSTFSFAHDGERRSSRPPPTVEITSPLDGSATRLNTLDVVVHWKGPIDKKRKVKGKVKLVELTLNDKIVGTFKPKKTERKDGTHTFSVNLTGVTEGVARLQAKAFRQPSRKDADEDDDDDGRDEDRNCVGVSAIVRVTVDRTAPAITITRPTNGNTITETRPLIEAAISDALSGINSSSVNMKLDGNTVAATFSNGVLSFTPSSPLSEGSHQIVVAAADKAGNRGSRKAAENAHRSTRR
jgi:hypothetical protein